MSKVITSPSERWPGTVTLQSPLYLPQAAAFEAALAAADALPKGSTGRSYFAALMPGVYACIERIQLKDWTAFSPERFPADEDGAEIAAWLVSEVTAVYKESTASPPKASTPSPTPKPSAEAEQAPEAPSSNSSA